MRRRRFVTMTFGGLILGLGPVAFGAPAVAQAPVPAAGDFVNDLSMRAIRMLTGSDLNEDMRADRFRTLLREAFDVPAIGRFTLGRYWRVATEAERGEYLKLFEDYLVQNYAGKFKDYTGENLRVLQTRATPENEVMVASQYIRNSGGPIQVSWRLRREGSSFKIIDVIVEGVSMAITQRDDYSAAIQRSGGKVEFLLVALREKTSVAAATPVAAQ